MTPFHKDPKTGLRVILVGVLLMVLCCILVDIASADLLYFTNNTPDNNPLEPRVTQGDTIYLGKTYDMSAITGFSYEYAWWSNWKEENINCNPDKTVDIRYYRTLENKYSVYLDPEVWKEGNWYMWDAYECNISYYNFNTLEREYRNMPFQADNKFAFTIKRQENVYTPYIPVETEALKEYQPIYTIEPVSTPIYAPEEKNDISLDAILKYGLLVVMIIAGSVYWHYRE